MNILVLAPLLEENFNKLKQSFPEFHFTMASSHEVTQEMIDRSDIIVGNPALQYNLNNPSIKAILLDSAGSDAYVKEGLLAKETQLANASGTYGKAISEQVIGMILSLNKHLVTYHDQQSRHLYKPIAGGKEIYHSTVIIVGLGDIGYQCAKRLKAFDCTTIGIKRRVSEGIDYVDELYTTDSLDEVLPRGDYIISALPQSPSTIHLFNKERFLEMKEDAVFINVGRGSAVDEADLVEVLKAGHLYGVGLDVFEQEPLPKESALWDFDNVIITPHCAGGYEWASTRAYYTDLVISNIKHLLNHETLENEVDFQTGYRKIVRRD